MRKPFLVVILWVSVSLSSQGFVQSLEVKQQPEDLVQSTPLNSFSPKTEAWPVDSISKDTFEVQGASIYEALNKYPGIQTKNERSGGSPSIRIRGSGSSARTLLLFDGTPINAHEGTGANPLLLPTEILQTIDILKGPSSLFYGSDAVGGALNLKPQKFTDPLVRLGYGSFNNPSLLLGSPLIQKENHFLQGTVFTESSDGDFRANNDRKKQRYSLLGENKFFNTTLSHHFIYANESGSSPGPIPPSTPYVTDFYNQAFLGAIHVQQKINSNLNFRYKLSHTLTDNDNLESGTTTNWYATKTLQSASVDYQIFDYTNLEVFTDFSIDGFKNSFTNIDKSDEHFEHGMILKTQLSENDYLLTGLRYFPDQNEIVKNILFRQDRKKYELWASYSEGIRIPDFTQKFGDNAFFTGNPNLTPEKSSQIEVGAQTQFKRSKLKISAYKIEYSDFIQFVDPAAPFSYENLENVTTKGLELQVSTDHKIYHGLLSYSLMDSENQQTGADMPLVPNHQLYGLLGAQLAAFVFELHNTYWTSYKLDATNDSNSWYTMDVTVRTSGLIGWNFRAGVLNLFGKERLFTNGYPEPKTQYFVFAEKSF